MTSTLPPELLAKIADEAAGDLDSIDRTTLRHLCLTSKSFLPFGRAALYRNVSITFEDAPSCKVEDQNEEDIKEEHARVLISPRGRLLKATIESFAHLGGLVEGLLFCFENEEWSGEGLSSEMLESLLNLCPQVRRFGVRGAVADAEATSLEEELLSKLPPLVELRFAPGKTFDQLLSQIPTLKHLELFEARGKPSKAGKKSSPYPSKLVSLAIETGAPLPPLLLVLRSSSSTLHHLSLDTHTLAKLATEITNLPNLDHLSLLIIRRDKRTSVDILDEIFNVLVDCSTLRTLDLACDEYIDFYPSDVDRLPSRLHAIRLALWFKDETLQKLLNDGNRRDLRHVVVGKNEMREEFVVLARKAGWEAYRGAEGVRFSR